MAQKPLVVVHPFQEQVIGFKEYTTGILEEHFQIIEESELEKDESLFERIAGILLLAVSIPESIVAKKENQEKMPNLKVVSTMSAGYNHIDVAYLKERGVRVGTVGAMTSDAVAEMAITHVLYSARHFREGIARAQNSSDAKLFWTHSPQQQATGTTMGLIGMGNIGFEIARRAHAFKMNVLYFDIRRRTDDGEVGGTFVEKLSDLLAQSDYVVIACPLNKHTRNMITAKELKLMKPTSFLINIARGAIIDHMALAEACSNGTINGAGLDVTNPEPLPEDHPLRQCANVTITPHWGSKTLKTRLAMCRVAVDNLVAVLAGDGKMSSELQI